MDKEEPYVYAHIFVNPDDASAYEREIIPAGVIKKFDYVTYKQNKTSFKNKCFKFRRSEGAKKIKCCILYADDTFDQVHEYVKVTTEKNKRWPIPNQKIIADVTGIDDSSIVHDVNLQADEIVQAKSKKKSTKKANKENKQIQAQKLIDKYIEAEQEEDEIFTRYRDHNSNNTIRNRDDTSNNTIRNRDNYSPDNFGILDENNANLPTSTPLNVHGNSYEAALRAYEMQAQYFKSQAEKWKTLYEKTKEKPTEKSANYNDKNIQEKKSFEHYDRMFNYKWIQENQKRMDFSDTESTVTLRRNVICNSLAYKNAYKLSNPSEFITTISVGIYGREDFSNRCVKKQSNTANQVQIDEVKTEVIEEEFYNFLRVKRFTLEQIELHLGKLNRYHHNAITTTRKRLQKQRAEDERQLDALQRQQGETEQMLQNPNQQQDEQTLQNQRQQQQQMDENTDVES